MDAIIKATTHQFSIGNNEKYCNRLSFGMES